MTMTEVTVNDGPLSVATSLRGADDQEFKTSETELFSTTFGARK